MLKGRKRAFRKVAIVIFGLILVLSGISAIFLSSSGISTQAAKLPKLIESAKAAGIAYDAETYKAKYTRSSSESSNRDAVAELAKFSNDPKLRQAIRDLALAGSWTEKEEQSWRLWRSKIPMWIRLMEEAQSQGWLQDSSYNTPEPFRDLSRLVEASIRTADFRARTSSGQSSEVLEFASKYLFSNAVANGRMVSYLGSFHNGEKMVKELEKLSVKHPKLLVEHPKVLSELERLLEPIDFVRLTENAIASDIELFDKQRSFSEIGGLLTSEPYWRLNALSLPIARKAFKATYLEGALAVLKTKLDKKNDKLTLEDTVSNIRPHFQKNLPFFYPVVEDLGPFVGIVYRLDALKLIFKVSLQKLRAKIKLQANMTP